MISVAITCGRKRFLYVGADGAGTCLLALLSLLFPLSLLSHPLLLLLHPAMLLTQAENIL